MLSVYYPTKEVLNGNNVDNQDQPYILTSYKTCMKIRSKEIKEEAAALREKMKNKLLDGWTYTFIKETETQTQERKTVSSNVLYYLCGYLLHSKRALFQEKCPAKTRLKDRKYCEECLKTVKAQPGDLPIDFGADGLLQCKNRGGLTYVTPAMLSCFQAVEDVVKNHFEQQYFFAIKDSF